MEKEIKPIHNYTSYGWEGSNYRSNKDLGIAEIAKIIRAKLTEEYSECKFSVTISRYSMGQSMTVALMAAPFEVFDTSKTEDKNGNAYTDANWGRGYAQLNQYSLTDQYTDGYCNGSYLTEKAWEVLKGAYKFANSFNFDDSDAQSDYFHNNYYLHLNVGKWDKPITKTN